MAEPTASATSPRMAMQPMTSLPISATEGMCCCLRVLPPLFLSHFAPLCCKKKRVRVRTLTVAPLLLCLCYVLFCFVFFSDDFGSGFGGFGGGGGASSGSGDDGGSSSGGSSKGGSGSDGSGGGGSGGSGSRAGGFNQEILSYHNKARGDHSVGQLTWDDTLAKYATDYLNKVNCDFKHSGGKYGENIAMGYPTPTKAMEAWYNEGKDYNYNNPGFSEGTGHFTQMVWKGTNKIGCGQAKCSQGPYLVCEYDPAGNVEGGDNFKKNVLPPK